MAQDMTMSLVDSIKNGIHIGRNDLVALTALVAITATSLLFPYVVVPSYIHIVMLFAPYPYDAGTPVYLLSVLADDSPYHEYSAIISVVHTYGYIFILLTQVMGILHMLVGSGRARPSTGLLLSVIVSAIWIYLCHVLYGPVALGLPVQLPFVPLLSSALMLLYREKRWALR